LRNALIPALLAAISAAVVWAGSSYFTGHSEPWDGDGAYYVGGLLVAGIVAGIIAPYALWAHYCGAIFGQFLYMSLFQTMGPLVVIGVFFLAFYALIFLGGSFLGVRIRAGRT
jgi:hypothetical protein